MSAASAIRAARAAGITVIADGEELVLEAAAEPPSHVIEDLRRHKQELLKLVALSNFDEWSRADWRAFFDERAGIAEFDGGLPRDQAEAHAFECCVVEWLNRNLIPTAPDSCLGCGEPERDQHILLPFGTQKTGHVWLHSRCWHAWQASRKAEAEGALSIIGIFAERKMP